jgi:hypothetical protein
MAAVSFNLQLLLIAFSAKGTGAKDEFDPSNPFAKYDPDDPSTYPFQGQCSFLRPQYCSAIQSVFDIVETPDGFVFQPGTPLPGTIGFEDAEPRCSFAHPHSCENVQQHLRQVRRERRAALRGCADEEAADERRRGSCTGG